MSKIENQQERISNLLKLISENPDLEIVPMVDTECVSDDSCYSNWMASWGDARIDYYYCSDERIYFKDYDFDDVVQEFIDQNCDEEEYKNLSDEEFEKIAENKVEDYEWVKAIIVSIEPN